MMPEVMPDDPHLFDVFQGLVIMFALFVDHLAGKGKFFLCLFALYDLCGTV